MMQAPYDLTGRSILIPGAAGGIGAATARLCARLGARLKLTDRVDLAPLVATLRGDGFDVDSLTLDAREKEAPRAIANWAGPLDAAVLAAGVYQPVDWHEEEWPDALDAALSANLVAPMRLSRELAESMARRGGGRLVFVGSIVATTGGSFPGVGPHYAASKGGLHTLVRWLAGRYTAQGVLTNAVAPGLTNTSMVSHMPGLKTALTSHPMGRPAEPDEIAWPLAFFCSPGASFISGAILDVNGGSMMRP